MSTISSNLGDVPIINGRRDYTFADALSKVSPQAQAKAKSSARDFEAFTLQQSERTCGAIDNLCQTSGQLPIG